MKQIRHNILSPKRVLFLLLLLIMPHLAGYGRENFQFHLIGMGKEVKVSCIAIEPSGTMWIGLDGDGLAVKESMEAVPVFHSKMDGDLPSDVILCTYKDRQNRRWFGTFGDGVFYFKDGRFTDAGNKELAAYNIKYCTGIADDRDSTMWFATNQAGLFAYDKTGKVEQYTMGNTVMETNTITDLKAVNDTIIYVATGWGLYVLNTANRRINVLADNNGRAFLSKKSVRVLMLNKSDLWIGTKTGIYIYNQNTHRYRHMTVADGLADDTVKAICMNKNGCVWVTSPSSVTRIAPDYTCEVYGKEELGETEFHVRALACTNDGQMLFGTLKGLMIAESTPWSSEANPWQWIIAVISVAAIIAIAVLLLRKRKAKSRHSLFAEAQEEEAAENVKQPHIDVKPTEIEINSADTQLIERAKTLVEEHISDTDYSVENLSAAMGMSRGYLYKRITALTGLSPLEFMRKLKVERGRQLLEKSGESISQIAWQVGLSPKQFSKYFKETYNVLPSEFIKRQD